MPSDLVIDPCPFCGGDGKILSDVCHTVFGVEMATAVVECTGCLARGTPAVDVGRQKASELAVHNWNTRSERSCHNGKTDH